MISTKEKMQWTKLLIILILISLTIIGCHRANQVQQEQRKECFETTCQNSTDAGNNCEFRCQSAFGEEYVKHRNPN